MINRTTAIQGKWREGKSSPYTGKLSARPAGKPGAFPSSRRACDDPFSATAFWYLLLEVNTEAPQYAFSRQGGIYRSDVVQTQKKSQNQIPGREPTASRWSAPSPGKRTGREDHALLIVRDEFRTGYSLIGLLASIARLRFTGTRRLTCTPRGPREKTTFLLCQRHDISTLP
jgi:hypothetical protein